MKQRIYPDSYADMLVKRAGEKWRPSNGTEGDLFFASWCFQCARDRSMSEGADYDELDDGDVCEIIPRTFLHDVDAPEYPIEWQYGTDGQPCCTAFHHKDGEPVTHERCKHTADMFTGDAA